MSIALGLVLFGMAAMQFPATAGAAGKKSCGAVRGYLVKVEKGAIGCGPARGVSARFIKGAGGSSCGTSMRPACVVGRYHCRAATPGERPLAGYCYVLKRPKPAARDFSFYKPRRFRVAITLTPTANPGGKGGSARWKRCGAGRYNAGHTIYALRATCKKARQVERAVGRRGLGTCIDGNGCRAARFYCHRRGGSQQAEGGLLVCRRGKQLVRFSYGG